MSSTSRGFLASPEGRSLLQAAKAERGWTFAAIAERAGVGADTVSRLFHPERGKRVSGESVKAIAGVLGVEVAAIVVAEKAQDPLAKAKSHLHHLLDSKIASIDLSSEIPFLEFDNPHSPISRSLEAKTTALDTKHLASIIDSLPEFIFEKLLFALNPPLEISRDRNKSQVDRTINLLEWAINSEPGLEAIVEILGEIIDGHVYPDIIHAPIYARRLKLIDELSDLPSATFNQILFVLNPPTGIIPGQMAAMTFRAVRLLEWTESDSGPGILSLLDVLSRLTTQELAGRELEIPGVFSASGYLEAEKRINEAIRNNFKRLDLSCLCLRVIPDEITRIQGLQEINLSFNWLASVPQKIIDISTLTCLNLSHNRVQFLSVNICYHLNLEEMDLSHNQLRELPEEMSSSSRLGKLYLHENKMLGLPVEILGPTSQEVGKGSRPAAPKDIWAYYYRLKLDDSPLNEAKLLLVGFGAAGKTSLVNRLIHKRFNPESPKTEGIQITPWEMRLNNSEDIKLHVWDFGGQEIMHSTHQFFLTERSLYLLVLNGRQGHEDADAEYWLELIQSFGGDSPVLVVLNKIKEHPFDVNRGALQQKFPNIREFIQTDCETGQGIDHLRTAIERETDALEHLRDPFPASWVAIKDKLSEMADNYISFEQYRAICKTDGETDFGAQDSLAVHLHSLGIALNYKDDPRLRDTHVLNPHWVTSGIYTLLNAEELAHSKGELEAACLTRNLDAHNYPAERHGFLLDLMRKFELCFRFEEDENRYLIPDLLDKQQPAAAAEFDPADCLNFRYEYPILPEGLLPRFIVRTHVLSEHQLRWRTGVILHFEGNRALVKADPQDRCVSISVDGPVASRRRLLAVIRSDFERIHRSFKFKPKELVPVPGHPDVTVDYKELLVREEHRQTSFDVFTGEGLISLNVRDLLNGVDLEGTRQPAMDRHSQALRLFYSYSHKDETLRDELETHLKLLQRQGLIQPWHDRRILPGSEWGNDIDDNLNRADIILLLVSPDFMFSDYCYDLEMTRALERHNNGEAIVIPIIVRPVDWHGTPFSKLQFLPKNAEPVTQWGDRDAAWLNVETGIKQVVESVKGKGL